MPAGRVAVLCLVLLLAGAACRRGAGPVVDPTAGPAKAEGTISGTLQKPADGGGVAGRLVRAVNVQSRQAFETRTNPAGGFTFLVPPGTYRLEVQLLAGEQMHNPPDTITIEASDIEADIRLTVGPPPPTIP